jgi:hypothetical protein
MLYNNLIDHVDHNTQLTKKYPSLGRIDIYCADCELDLVGIGSDGENETFF